MLAGIFPGALYMVSLSKARNAPRIILFPWRIFNGKSYFSKQIPAVSLMGLGVFVNSTASITQCKLARKRNSMKSACLFTHTRQF